jgi:hypothetical protein
MSVTRKIILLGEGEITELLPLYLFTNFLPRCLKVLGRKNFVFALEYKNKFCSTRLFKALEN